MSDYSRQHDFSAKDSLTTGDPNKLIKGSEVDAEFDAIVTAVASKQNTVGAADENALARFDSTGQIEDSGVIVSTYSGDASRPWFVGEHGFADNTTDGGATDYPVVRIQRDNNHTGGLTSGVNQSALSVATNINKSSGRADNYENGIVSSCYCYRNDTVTASPNITAFQGGTFKYNNSTGGFFGANFLARDETGNESSVSKGGLVGAELDIIASGPDDDNLRIVCDVIARAYTTHASAASCYAGVRVRPSESSVAGGGAVPMTLKYAFLAAPGGLGSIETGLYVAECSQWGAYIGGWDYSANYAHLEVRGSSAQALVRIGTDDNTSAATAARVNFIGKNDASELTNYGSIRSIMAAVTDGTESGTTSLTVMAAGTDTTVMQLRGASGSNPLFVRVGGALEQVTAGANDSGGSGYRVLRVPN